jgi:hypothetical protein
MVVIRSVTMIIPHSYFISMIQIIVAVSAWKITPVNPGTPFVINKH